MMQDLLTVLTVAIASAFYAFVCLDFTMGLVSLAVSPNQPFVSAPQTEQSAPRKQLFAPTDDEPVKPDEQILVPESKTSWSQSVPQVDFTKLKAVELRRECA